MATAGRQWAEVKMFCIADHFRESTYRQYPRADSVCTHASKVKISCEYKAFETIDVESGLTLMRSEACLWKWPNYGYETAYQISILHSGFDDAFENTASLRASPSIRRRAKAKRDG
ncbi:hypothetical protein D7S86_11420 [Pararobbsia silviterrae]|uniref:Uncharacterized protein n=1 Tax=Pararobbsia silviterrae TaxID=1792498 RepID=A0A494Y1D4_9BURK|nr:hypothetical protein D7S86_11420 [Pararobbsia silviterrae]